MSGLFGDGAGLLKKYYSTVVQALCADKPFSNATRLSSASNWGKKLCKPIKYNIFWCPVGG